jgi:HEPN domain-containing protein
MKKIFSPFTREPLTMVIDSIVRLILPEKIFLLSVLHRAQESENIFGQAPVTKQVVVSFYLLVLAAETDTRSNHDLQDIIEHRSGHNIDITAFVLPVHQFNDWLIQDHPFASRVYQQASLLYDAGITPLAIPGVYNEAATTEMLRSILDTHTAQALEFIAGAGLFMLRKQYGLAAFHLHQAAEQIYSGIIRFLTGLRVQTHNLDKLYRYARHLLPALDTAFPRDSETEKELFRWLQKAYADGRYNSDFSVKHAIISQLSERVQKLLELCKTLQYSKTTHT